MIKIKNLTRYYGSFLAVDNIDFEVEKGEILGFLGPNGAGKTTTMKIITGFLLPTSGQVTVDNQDVVEHSMTIRKKIGYLPEHNALYHDMGIMEYLRFIMEARQIPKHEQNKRLSYVIDVCGLKNNLSKNIGELSKGFRQRVGLAQSMIHDPEILILDEPTVGLDPNQIVEIRNLIKQIGTEKTIILSTHILPEVEVTCDRVVIINNGNIAAIGTTDDLQKNFQGKNEIELTLKDDQSDFKENLSQIPGVLSCQADFDGQETHFMIESSQQSDLRQEIFQLVVNKNLTLLGLQRQQISLEKVFHELTLKETA